LVSSPDGVLGLCYEHSVAEGIAVVAVLTQLVQEVDSEGKDDVEPSSGYKLEEVNFVLDDDIKEKIMKANLDLKQ